MTSNISSIKDTVAVVVSIITGVSLIFHCLRDKREFKKRPVK